GNIASVDICYAADGVSFPNPCNTIKDNFSMTADTMTITDWTPPQTIGTGYKIKIVDASDDTVSVISPAFKVGGKLSLTAPLTSTTWAIGETRNITWDINQGNVANVKILGSKSGNFTGGTDEFTITASTQADNVVAFNPANPDPRGKGQYTWTLVDTYPTGSILTGPPAALKVKVFDAATDFPLVMTAGSAALTVTGQLTVNTPPAAGQAGVWRVGDTDKSVTWAAQGQMGLVKIELDPDGAGAAAYVEITDPANRAGRSVAGPQVGRSPTTRRPPRCYGSPRSVEPRSPTPPGPSRSTRRLRV
ncbi:MAG: hypothetical protein HYY59_02935, partial [Candidatus Omnitrophica bacterium]|nr:hypothetical protein [Candidatus Omnitrophota bacterium]